MKGDVGFFILASSNLRSALYAN